MAIPASVARAEAGFDFINLAPSVHFFNVMAYDLHGIWDDPRIAGAHSDIVGIGEAIDYILNNSTVPASQVVLGLPAYGRSFTLSDDTCLSLGCPFKKNSNVTAIGKCFLVFVDTIDARTCSDFALFLLFL
jgi:chitinase